jgi:hypothetical protein
MYMRVTLRGLVLGIGFLWVGSSSAGAPDWLPVNTDELHMTSLSQAPGASAVILYRQIDRNDDAGYEDGYVRVKILTEDGRKYGDVEIPFYKDAYSVRDIFARTIRPDGTIVPFAGAVYEKQLSASQGGTVAAKTFQLPDVDPGCVLEYRYRIAWSSSYMAGGGFGSRAFNSQWLLNAPLYTVEGKFSLVPERALSLRFSWPNGLPAGSAPPRFDDKRVVMQVHDVPAFVTEEYMPPAADLMSRVDFIYSNEGHPETDQAAFWKKFGINTFKINRNFIDERSAMERALSQIVAPGDPPEPKLRKIYARVQRVRNLSYLPRQTQQERERQEPAPRNVAEIWERDAGYEPGINWLFLALARAAGFTADPVLVATRNEYRFEPRFLNPARLNGTAVLITLGGSTRYFNPGVPDTPYGMLPWNETDASGLRLNEDGGSWVTTPLPDASVSRVERTADLTLSGGSLDGKLTVSYTGIEAARRRLQERNEDDAGRRQFLEKEVEAMVPTGVDVKLINTPDWNSDETPLVAQFDLRIPVWATVAGRRELVPIGVFGAGQRHMFEHTSRVHPVYFEYPRQYNDTVTIALPAGWHVDSVPPDSTSDLKVLKYASAARAESQSLRLTRDLNIGFLGATAGSYPAIEGFFEKVRTGDEQQAVVAPDAASPH